jgi:F0F1-type ATP synthase membrane subunit b/b'
LSRLTRSVLRAILLGVCLAGLVGMHVPGLSGAGVVWARTSEGAEEGTPRKHEELYKIINFVILVGGLAYLLRKPLVEFLAQRSASIRKSLDEGRKALEVSQAQLKVVEERLARLQEEIAAFRASAACEMEEERKHLQEMAAAEAEKMLQAARTEMDTATRAGMLGLRLYAAEQAVKLAEQMIRERLDKEGRQRLLNQFLAKLDTKKKRDFPA